MRTPHRHTLGKIPGGAISGALGRFEEPTTDRREALSLSRERCLSAVKDLVEVIETTFIEVVLALAERTDQRVGRSATTKVAVSSTRQSR